MSELAGFAAEADWLPASVRRAQAAEDAAERGEARAEEQAREARREASHDRALNAYRNAAESRGEVVSALALATGAGLGRSIGDVLADAAGAADREDGRAAAKQRHEDGDVVFIDSEPVIHGASRSGWPATEYELGSLLERASDLHRWGVMYQARLASRRGEDPAAAVRRVASRASYPHQGEVYGEITRVTSADGMGQLGTLSGEIIR